MASDSSDVPPLPQAADGLTPSWLGVLLNRPDAVLTTVEVDGIDGATSFSGSVARLRLTWSPAEAGPASAIVKLPSATPQIRALISALGMYQREAVFLTSLAPMAPVRIPRLLGHALDGSGGAILVLEDLAPARAGDQLAGLEPMAAAPILRRLARLHAHWWQSDALTSLPWLPSLDQGPDLASFYGQSWQGFDDRFGDALPAALRRCGPNLGPRLAGLRRNLAQSPSTLVHGDLRLDNLLFDEGEPIFLDWQTVAYGRGMFDVGYLCAGSLLDHDPAAIRTLLTVYADELAAAGVADYDLAAITADYNLVIAFLWARTVTAGARLGFAAGPAHDRFMVALTRWLDAATQSGAMDMLIA